MIDKITVPELKLHGRSIAWVLIISWLLVISCSANGAQCRISEPALLPSCAGFENKDEDEDGIANHEDNCRLAPNPRQIDTDSDGFGNACDADLDGDGLTGINDLRLFSTLYSSSGVSHADFNGDGKVDAVDFWRFWQQLSYPPGPSNIDCHDVIDVGQHGIIANDPSAASANTLAFRALVSPKEYGGNGIEVSKPIVFPGGRTYHFDDVIPFRFDKPVTVDLRGSRLRFSKSAQPVDQGTGFIFSLGKLLLENGTIDVDYDASQAPVHAGAAIMLGTRSSAGSPKYFKNLWDADLDDQMGDITLRNLHVTSNNDPSNGLFASRGILMLGGLQNVCMENVSIDGQGKMDHGIAYEFGFGVKPVAASAEGAPGLPGQSSHAHDMLFRNITVTNLSPGVDISLCENKNVPCDVSQVALRFGGAYDILVDGLTIDQAEIGFQADTGESLFYYPWGQIPEARQRIISLRNVKISNAITGLSLSGSSAATGYLRHWSKQIGPPQRTDLLFFELADITLVGGKTGAGISCYGSGFTLKGGQNGNRISGFWNAITADSECTHIDIDQVAVTDTSSIALRLDFDPGQHYPSRRRKTGQIRNSSIERSGSYAISIDYTQDFRIVSNQFGHADEKTPFAAVIVTRPKKQAAQVDAVPGMCSGLSQLQCADQASCVWSTVQGQSCEYQELLLEANEIRGSHGSELPFVAREDRKLYGAMVLRGNKPDNRGRGPWILKDD